MDVMALPASALQEVEDDITGTQSAALSRESKMRRNSLLPINQLPVEVLCRIFIITRNFCMPTSRYYRRQRYQKVEDCSSWIYVSHVSTFWRDAALHEPRLWSIPPLCYPKWTPIMLARSGTAPMQIELDIRHPLPTSQLEIPSLNLFRITHLWIEGTNSQPSTSAIHEILASLVGIDAPMLEKLVISPYPFNSWMRSRTPHLPNNVFQNTARLRCLKLFGLNLDWPSRILSGGLTTLEIYDIPRVARPTTEQFLTTLRQMPDLRKLKLINALPSSASCLLNTNDQNPVSLSCLEDLQLSTEGHQFNFFINSVILSRKATHISVEVKLEGNIQILDDSVLRKISIGACHNFRSVVIRTDDNDNIIFEISQYAQGVLGNDYSPAPRTVYLSISLYDDTATLRGSVWTYLFNILCWDHLTEIDLRGIEHGEASHQNLLASTFGGLPTIRTTYSDNFTLKLLVDVLKRAHNADCNLDGNPKAIMAFTGLRHLILYGSYFDPSGTDDINENVAARYKLLFGDFLEMLTDRRNFGCGIEHLQLNRTATRLTPQQLEQLGLIVAEFSYEENLEEK